MTDRDVSSFFVRKTIRSLFEAQKQTNNENPYYFCLFLESLTSAFMFFFNSKIPTSCTLFH